jgi:hypothetical protein
MKTIKYEIVECIPNNVEEGILYISLMYETSRHKCPCGCETEIIVPCGKDGWEFKFNGDLVSITPSIGNFYLPCKSHYYITNNEIIEY